MGGLRLRRWRWRWRRRRRLLLEQLLELTQMLLKLLLLLVLVRVEHPPDVWPSTRVARLHHTASVKFAAGIVSLIEEKRAAAC